MRNFAEGKGRILCKMNWIQTVVLAIMTGLVWFQVCDSFPHPNYTWSNLSYKLILNLFMAFIHRFQERKST